MKKSVMVIAAFSLLLSSCNFMARVGHSLTGVQKITKEELKTLLSNKDITIIDVRDTKHWEPSRHKIPGAIRENPYDVKSWANKYSLQEKLILYCG